MATDPISVPNQEAVDSATRLYHSIHTAFPKAVADFESKWAAAHDPDLPERSPNVENDACIRAAEFDTLEWLGPKIIPLLVFKLARDDPGQNLLGLFFMQASRFLLFARQPC